ncbi:TlpA family protein disulfide reductase [Solirubrobacter ginsenosidimutans]|uniref:TlpA family protein disulfide reductase n=2 Tax=Solirubrobacter ginsenosidimutans TaxID=490573 RepID=A0A9X3MYU8_9ACTN|nr:TlpA family protein disulfide reductase [Solirubrobacter ginsenosidimutans]
MRRVVCLCMVLLLAGCGGAALSHDGGRATLPGPLPSGVRFAAATSKAQAPPFSLKLLDGTPVQAAKLWGDRPVVVFFFASWCSRCAAQQDRLAPLVKRYRDVVTFVGVGAQDKAPAVKSWLDAHDVTYPVAIDGGQDMWRRYAVRQPPAVVLIAPGGKLERGWTGGVTTDVLDTELKRLVQR